MRNTIIPVDHGVISWLEQVFHLSILVPKGSTAPDKGPWPKVGLATRVLLTFLLILVSCLQQIELMKRRRRLTSPLHSESESTLALTCISPARFPFEPQVCCACPSC